MSAICLRCSNNAILEMEEVRYANPLPLLKNLQITGNAISSYRLSRLHLLYLIPQVGLFHTLNSRVRHFILYRLSSSLSLPAITAAGGAER